ncbi:MAG: EF-hand domain-containing protein [Brevundimonas sp.]|uniref:EF-hand domain-containing protein n=1 Tax=Brevundimonas sp. TaxID=1871086 RepID=UPI004034B009
MTRAPAFAASLIALLTSAPALAQDVPQSPPPGGAARMGGGGMMGMMLPRTTADVGPWSGRVFTRLDGNQDGSITADELSMLMRPEVARMGGSRLRAMISQSDSNRDARVSREEFDAGALRMFQRMDANGDGQLTGEELPQPPAQARPMPIPMPTQPDPMPMPFPDSNPGR